MFINRYACKNVDLCYMAVRKTQKKHLGKKRKSLSKRKAHSKKKRHSKQRITKKRSHKGGGDDDEDEVYNPLTDGVRQAEEEEEERRKAKEEEEIRKAEEEKRRKAKEEEKRRKADNLNSFSRASIQKGLDRFKKDFNNLGGGKAHSKQRITKKRYHKGGGDDEEEEKEEENEEKNEEENLVDILRKIIKHQSTTYDNKNLKQRLLACINGKEREDFYEGDWNEADQDYVKNLEYIIELNSPTQELTNKLLTCINNATETKLDNFFNELIDITEKKKNDLNSLKTNLENKINKYHDDEEIKKEIKKELKNIIEKANEVKDLQNNVQDYVLDEQGKNFKERFIS